MSQVQLKEQDVSLVTSLVGEDGVMVLKLVGANSSELLVRDVVSGIARLVRGGALTTSGQVLYHPVAGQSIVPGAPPGVYPNIEKAEP